MITGNNSYGCYASINCGDVEIIISCERLPSWENPDDWELSPGENVYKRKALVDIYNRVKRKEDDVQHEYKPQNVYGDKPKKISSRGWIISKPNFDSIDDLKYLNNSYVIYGTSTRNKKTHYLVAWSPDLINWTEINRGYNESYEKGLIHVHKFIYSTYVNGRYIFASSTFLFSTTDLNKEFVITDYPGINAAKFIGHDGYRYIGLFKGIGLFASFDLDEWTCFDDIPYTSMIHEQDMFVLIHDKSIYRMHDMRILGKVISFDIPDKFNGVYYVNDTFIFTTTSNMIIITKDFKEFHGVIIRNSVGIKHVVSLNPETFGIFDKPYSEIAPLHTTNSYPVHEFGITKDGETYNRDYTGNTLGQVMYSLRMPQEASSCPKSKIFDENSFDDEMSERMFDVSKIHDIKGLEPSQRCTFGTFINGITIICGNEFIAHLKAKQ